MQKSTRHKKNQPPAEKRRLIGVKAVARALSYSRTHLGQVVRHKRTSKKTIAKLHCLAAGAHEVAPLAKNLLQIHNSLN